MSVRKNASGSYLVTVCHGGRTTRRASKHWTYRDAREVERRLQEQVRDAAAGRDPERLIADALERWLLQHVPTLADPRKARSDARALVPLIRGRRLDELGDVWEAVKAIRGERSAAWANHRGRILSQIGRMAWREWGWLDRPPVIKLLREDPRERFLTRTEVEALADATGNEAAAGYVLLAAYTGIRRGHLLRLTHHDVAGDSLRLDRSGKTGILQAVPLHPRVRAIAEQLPLPVSDTTLKRRWKAAREATGINCRWHDLRHTCASWLVGAGVPLYTVSKLLGHSSVTVTQRYAHLAHDDLRDAVGRM